VVNRQSQFTYDDTITAIITPPGEGGIAAVRVAGRLSRTLLEKHFRSASKRRSRPTPFVLRYGCFVDGHGEPVDEVTAVFMPRGRSYTGLDQVEIFCHGGYAVVKRILDELIASGARVAEPGEFTKLAFLSGRIDLTKAEAVAEIVSANTDQSYHAAREHLLGSYGEYIRNLREKIIGILAEVEASIDFPGEDIDPAESRRLIQTIEETSKLISDLAATYTGGRIIKEGYKLVIGGRPNAGKSSLFNLLLRQQRAIVTPTAGTTRDYLSEWIDLEGFAVNLIDTAGLRQGGGAIERAGQKSAMSIIAQADLLLWMVDLSDRSWEKKLQVDFRLVNKYNHLLVGNKIDLLKPSPKRTTKDGATSVSRSVGACPPPSKRQRQALPLRGVAAKRCEAGDAKKHEVYTLKSISKGLPESAELDITLISCLTGKGINRLKEKIIQRINDTMPDLTSGLVVTSARHRQKLQAALKNLRRAKSKMKQGESPELIAFDLRQAADAIDEITGKVYTEDILERIFSKFCIGK
jgi:tRNA modification GTPase